MRRCSTSGENSDTFQVGRDGDVGGVVSSVLMWRCFGSSASESLLATTGEKYLRLCAKARGPKLWQRAQGEAEESYQASMFPRSFVSMATA